VTFPAADKLPARQSAAGAVARVFRFEYLAAAFPGVTITFFMSARSPDDLLHRAPIEGLAAGLLIIFSCLGINAIVDREIDGQYLTDKTRIAGGVGVVGPARIWTIIAAMNVIAFVLAVDLCIQFGSFIPLALPLAQALCAYGYSVPPLQFKLRGVLPHALSLALATCFIPFILSVYTFLGTVPAVLAAYLLGFAVLQYGFEFSNQALDYLEDRAAGLKTPAVRLGVPGSLRTSLAVVFTGLLILCVVLLAMYFERSGETDPVRPRRDVLFAWGLSVLAVAAGYALPTVRTWQMLHLCRDQPPEVCVPKLPALCNYARWQTSSVTGIAAGTAVFFVVTNYVWR
jgi:4-hydroxybenzoate polyprenyltransferase